MSKTKEMTWTLAKVWNRSLEDRPKRKYQPRQRIWASEIKGSFIDRYLKMKGVEPTNPPNARSLRKFEAGNIWEAILSYVLKRAGILLDEQQWLKYQYPNLFPVTGKLDFLAGGNPDYDRAIKVVDGEFDWLPPSLKRAAMNIISHLREYYPQGLKKIILELKSCSSFMFENYERNNAPAENHKCQIFHYLKAKNMTEGHIVYVSKDDARLLEFGIFNPSYVEDIYKQDIEKITEYVKSGTQPPKEKAVVYSNDLKKFSINYKVTYSNYLTKLYGFKSQHEVEEKYKKTVSKWNRVLKRIEEGKNLTDNNREVLEEIRKAGFNLGGKR